MEVHMLLLLLLLLLQPAWPLTAMSVQRVMVRAWSRPQAEAEGRWWRGGGRLLSRPRSWPATAAEAAWLRKQTCNHVVRCQGRRRWGRRRRRRRKRRKGWERKGWERKSKGKRVRRRSRRRRRKRWRKGRERKS